MNLAFAEASDSILLQALKIIDALNCDSALEPCQVQETLLACIRNSDARMGLDPGWKLARYAIVAWIDEMLVDHHWPGAKWWSNNVLEVALFSTRLCSTQFFALAREAAALPERDALEVFHNCVMLGFRGMYTNPTQVASLANALDLPDTLQEWVRIADQMITNQSSDSTNNLSMDEITGAAPHSGRIHVAWLSIAAIVLFAFNMILYRS